MKEIWLERGYVSPNDEGVRAETDSRSIQNAVDAARSCGVGKVVIPRWNRRADSFLWVFDEPVLLRSHLTVVLDGCHLRMADGVYANFFRTANLYGENGPDISEPYEEIAIIGQGFALIDGGKANDLSEETQYREGYPAAAYNTPIFLYNTRRFAVENLTLRDQRYWGMRFEYCSEGRIAHIVSDVIADRRNQDGINLRNGCHHIVMEGIYGQSGDDLIALSAIDRVNPRKKYNLVVPEWDNDIHDVIIRDVAGCALTHPLVALRNGDGRRIFRITVENVSDTPALRDCERGKALRYALIRLGCNSYYGERPGRVGEMDGITLRNISAQYSERAIVVDAGLSHSRFENIRCTGRCAVAVATGPDWDGIPGAQIESLEIDGLMLKPERGWDDDCWYAATRAAALEFEAQRPGDYLRGVTLRNAVLENVDHALVLSGDSQLYLENVRVHGMRGKYAEIREGDEERTFIG